MSTPIAVYPEGGSIFNEKKTPHFKRLTSKLSYQGRNGQSIWLDTENQAK